jgi:rare lipoprotein A
MRRRPALANFSSLMLAAGAVLAPVAHAATGGTGFGPSPGSTPPAGGATVQPANTTVQASGNGITVTTHATTLLRRRLTFAGQAAAPAGYIVEIERRGPQAHDAWVRTTSGPVSSSGGFTAVWATNHPGRFTIRAVLESPRATTSRATPTSPALTITVYRPAIATTYGPGFWGSQTACGQVLRHATLGVANRTLPCGTKVSLLWHGHTIVVPVIDRGPYANGADWDLTMATAHALGIPGTVAIGAVALTR